MARQSEVLVLVCLLAGCGGEGVRNHDPAASVAGSGGTATPSAGSGGRMLDSGGAGHGPGGAGGVLGAIAGAAGHAGTNAGGSGGFASGGVAGSAGAGGAAGGVSITTPEMLVPTVKAFCAAARTCCAKQPDPVMLDD